eukprot:857753-Prorocentrum_minimum.AAC.3
MNLFGTTPVRELQTCALRLTPCALSKAPPAGVARTRSFDRSMRANHNCPFGLAWRGSYARENLQTWQYRPPYLPVGMTTEVGDDPRQRLLFTFPRGSASIDWDDSRLVKSPESKRERPLNSVYPRARLNSSVVSNVLHKCANTTH